MECRHLDGVKTHNQPCNLMWGTRAENVADAVRHGTHGAPFGERHGAAKLKQADIPEILRMRREGMSLRAIGRKFGVAHPAIGRILDGRSRWLTDSERQAFADSMLEAMR
ncbi:hypothetical protein [Paludisphaera rhizosphaerae]|uniref:hypothetical protein n=1 Tax=Paludisphaera rhizosphaerae TaxID=2711216 RepID=UPI00389A1098